MQRFRLITEIAISALVICGMTIAVIGGLFMINAFLTKGCM